MEQIDLKMKYIKTMIVALLVVILLGVQKQVWEFNSNQELFTMLSDIFIIPGIVLLGVGIMVYASSKGFFDGFGYTFKNIKEIYSRDPVNDREDYYDYKVRRAKKYRVFKHYFVVGGIMLIISVIFLFLYSTL